MRGLRLILLAAVFVSAVLPAYANSVLLEPRAADSTLRWKSGIVRISISTSLLRDNPNIKKDSDVEGAIRRSIEAWSRVADIELVQSSSDKVSASPAGAVGDGVSLVTIAATPENVLMFAKDPENAAATTRIFYNRRGLITEADIVLNPYQQFSTDGTLGTFDLESTLTHEIGHLLGLPHSLVYGSTMHESYGKNGVFGVQSFGSRTLSADDIASIRALYGLADDANCCGTISGRLTGSKQPKTTQVWIEDLVGRVYGSTRLSAEGEFEFSGLTAGKYRVFAQETSLNRARVSVTQIGEAIVESGEITAVTAKLVAGVRDFDLSYIGLNGQLSEIAVGLSAGRSYTLYIGGRGLDPKRLALNFTTPHISVVPASFRSHDYGDNLSVLSFEIRVSPRAQKGEFSLYADSDRGDRRAIVGAVTIDSAEGSDAVSTSLDD